MSKLQGRFRRVRIGWAGAAAALLSAAALLGPGASAQATVPHWKLAAAIKVGSAPSFAPDVHVAFNPASNTLYATSFAVPVLNGQAGFSRAYIISGKRNAVIKGLNLGSSPQGTPDRFGIDTVTNKVYIPLQVGRVQVINGPTGTLGASIGLPKGSRPYGGAVDSATHTGYATDWNTGTFYVVDGQTNKEVKTVTGLDDSLESPVLDDPPGKMFIAVQSLNYVLVVSTAGKNANQVIGGIYGNSGDFDAPSYMAVNAKTNRAYVVNDGNNTLTTINTVTDTVVGSPVKLGNTPFGVAVDTKTGTVFAATESNNGKQAQLVVLNAAASKVTARASFAAQSINDLTVNPVTGTVYIGGSTPSTGYVWVYNLG